MPPLPQTNPGLFNKDIFVQMKCNNVIITHPGKVQMLRALQNKGLFFPFLNAIKGLSMDSDAYFTFFII